MNPQLTLPHEAIQAFCRKWQITRLELFGSALRDDFGPESDIDFLVTFAPESHISLFKFITLEDEFSELLGRKVDLVSREAIEQSHNWIRRKEILGHATDYYAA